MGWYLCYFLHRHLDFRREELQALVDGRAAPHKVARAARWRRSPRSGASTSRPRSCRGSCRRSVLTRALIEVWGEGDTQEELNAAVKALPDERKDPYIAEGTTFKVCVEDFGKTARHEKNPWSHVSARRLKPVLQFRGRAR